MIDDDKLRQISVLAEYAERKRIHYNALGLQNMAGATPEELIKMRIAREVAFTEMIAADTLLTNLQKKLAGIPLPNAQ